MQIEIHSLPPQDNQRLREVQQAHQVPVLTKLREVCKISAKGKNHLETSGAGDMGHKWNAAVRPMALNHRN